MTLKKQTGKLFTFFRKSLKATIQKTYDWIILNIHVKNCEALNFYLTFDKKQRNESETELDN